MEKVKLSKENELAGSYPHNFVVVTYKDRKRERFFINGEKEDEGTSEVLNNLFKQNQNIKTLTYCEVLMKNRDGKEIMMVHRILDGPVMN